MKVLGTLVIAALLALLSYWEISWRLVHFEDGPSVASPTGRLVAQVRNLPESSDLPYGSGVFVRRSFPPLWASSEMVLAAYCKGAASVSWRSERHLEVKCEHSEGPILRPTINLGITVSFVGGA